MRTDVTRSGFVPNVETLLMMQPDLVWQWGHMGDDLIAPLRNAGLPVAALVYGTEDRTREWIRLIGLSLGQEARAQAQLQWRDRVRAGIRAVTDGLPAGERPGVLYLSRATRRSCARPAAIPVSTTTSRWPADATCRRPSPAGRP